MVKKKEGTKIKITTKAVSKDDDSPAESRAIVKRNNNIVDDVLLLQRQRSRRALPGPVVGHSGIALHDYGFRSPLAWTRGGWLLFQFLPGRAMKLRDRVARQCSARTKQTDRRVSIQQGPLLQGACAWSVLSRGCRVCCHMGVRVSRSVSIYEVWRRWKACLLTAAARNIASCCCVGGVSLDLLDAHFADLLHQKSSGASLVGFRRPITWTDGGVFDVQAHSTCVGWKWRLEASRSESI